MRIGALSQRQSRGAINSLSLLELQASIGRQRPRMGNGTHAGISNHRRHSQRVSLVEFGHTHVLRQLRDAADLLACGLAR